MLKSSSSGSQIASHAYAHQCDMVCINAILFLSAYGKIYHWSHNFFPILSEWNLLLPYDPTLTRPFKCQAVISSFYAGTAADEYSSSKVESKPPWGLSKLDEGMRTEELMMVACYCYNHHCYCHYWH